ncbi:MAG: hypothetical protein EHM20_08895 [Alphaproteobacteria bacterium]|nr:MAG: hypothetical protein EHM20_08895 [Alphaproteobacteria bacterium]
MELLHKTTHRQKGSLTDDSKYMTYQNSDFFPDRLPESLSKYRSPERKRETKSREKPKVERNRKSRETESQQKSLYLLF